MQGSNADQVSCGNVEQAQGRCNHLTPHPRRFFETVCLQIRMSPHPVTWGYEFQGSWWRWRPSWTSHRLRTRQQLPPPLLLTRVWRSRWHATWDQPGTHRHIFHQFHRTRVHASYPADPSSWTLPSSDPSQIAKGVTQILNVVQKLGTGEATRWMGIRVTWNFSLSNPWFC